MGEPVSCQPEPKPETYRPVEDAEVIETAESVVILALRNLDEIAVGLTGLELEEAKALILSIANKVNGKPLRS
jgi:hypothetical protein